MWEWFGELTFLGRIGVYILLGNIIYLIGDFMDGKFRSDDPERDRTPSDRIGDEMAISPPNEIVRREASKLRDLLLLHNHKADAGSLAEHAAKLDNPKSAEQALGSLDSMCHPKWLGELRLPDYDTGPGWYGWLQPLEEALATALRQYR
jgi:hypothetical protein